MPMDGLPLLNLPERDRRSGRDPRRRQRLADRATDIVLLGTGGSSLGGQTLAQLAGHGVPGVGALRSGPRLHFMDNLDPEVVRHAAGAAAAGDRRALSRSPNPAAPARR